MKPLFTIHGGEILVGEYIERKFKNVNVWLPTRDTGIDLLVTSRDNKRTLSLQVKFSKDYRMSHIKPSMLKDALAYGWWKFDRQKLNASAAEYWVLVLLPFADREAHFIIIKPQELANRYRALGRGDNIQTYLWITPAGKCIETRDLKKGPLLASLEAIPNHDPRDFSEWLGRWDPVEAINQ